MDRPSGSEQLKALGEFIRAQRKAAALSLRQMAELANVSNPYISQIERGLHEPSMRVMRSIADALNLPLDSLLARAGLTDPGETHEEDAGPSVEAAIAADRRLTPAQRDSLLAVYRTYIAEGVRPG